MILVTFAVPQESREFVSRLRHTGPLGHVLVGNLGCEEIAVLHTGMGADAARDATRRTLAELRPDRVIASGFAGGLDPALEFGQLIVAENLSTPALLAREPAGARRVRLASVESPLDTPADKSRIRAATGADAVDLESAAIAEVCATAAIPLLVLRIISDAAGESLPLPSGVAYDIEHQRIRPLAILNHLLTEPVAVTPLISFAHRLPDLQRALADALAAVISDQ
ncbi:MAG: hypothetical protein ABMA13_05475 [Chthoniobacteraceae bacterium]